MFYPDFDFDIPDTKNKKSRPYTKGPHIAKMTAKRQRQNKAAKQARKAQRKKK